jgi:hypothetical protein
MMNQATIARYQPGGDIYAQLEGQYGRNGALLISQAAATGDQDAVNDAFVRAKYGEKLDDSTASIFWHQITTDPFDAPLDSLNKGLGTAYKSAILGLLKNPWVLVTLAGLVFYALGGFRWLGAKLKLS